MSKDLAPLSDPGLPEHIHRKADVDVRAAKKAERQVGILFLFSVLGTLLFDHRIYYITLLHFTARNRFLDGNFDDVADTGVAAVRTTKNLNTHYAARAAVVCDFQHRLHLDHLSAPLFHYYYPDG